MINVNICLVNLIVFEFELKPTEKDSAEHTKPNMS